MNERDKATIEFIRSAIRPILLLLLGIGTLLLIVNDFDAEMALWWCRIFYAGVGEWILERPILKVTGKA